MNNDWTTLPPLALCRAVLRQFGEHTAFAFSGAEDVLVLDLLVRTKLPFSVFTLDTFRLHDETYGYLGEVERFFGVRIDVVRPRQRDLDSFVGLHGFDAMYESIDARRACCAVRKVEPLLRYLANRPAWITGLRQDQSPHRQGLPRIEEDEPIRGICKINPIAELTADKAWEHIHARGLPINPLHGKGYPSIGCAPCTRPIEPGADPRSGRWWWEREGHKECGLHLDPLRQVGEDSA